MNELLSRPTHLRVMVEARAWDERAAHNALHVFMRVPSHPTRPFFVWCKIFHEEIKQCIERSSSGDGAPSLLDLLRRATDYTDGESQSSSSPSSLLPSSPSSPSSPSPLSSNPTFRSVHNFTGFDPGRVCVCLTTFCVQLEANAVFRVG